MAERALARMSPNPAARHYHGTVAETYDQRRASSARWRAEHAIVAGWLDDAPAGTAILDVPIGTGRFLPLCVARGFDVLGIDMSDDMLAEARRKVGAGKVTLARGDIRSLPIADRSRDVALAVRILNLLGPDDLRRAMSELQRIANSTIICSLRISSRVGQMARGYAVADLAAHLQDDWRIAQDAPCASSSYRMLRLERTP